jgi:hypothetical protein
MGSPDTYRHKINNPLQVVLSNLEAIQQMKHLDNIHLAADDALAALQRLRSEIDALLDERDQLAAANLLHGYEVVR